MGTTLPILGIRSKGRVRIHSRWPRPSPRRLTMAAAAESAAARPGSRSSPRSGAARWAWSNSERGVNRDGDGVEPIVQVFAKGTVGHGLGDVTVAGGDHPHVGSQRLGPPYPLVLPSCSTRSKRTCTAGFISVTSSRNSVPPRAMSKRPSLRTTAPVNARFS